MTRTASPHVEYDPEFAEDGDNGRLAPIDNSSALAVIERSQIDVQISTAKRYPRSIKRFQNEAMQMATLDEETAESMFYAIPRSGKTIEGPSARLAEVVGSSWGNLRYGARVVGTDEKFVTAQGMCFDLEKNIAATVDVKRRITDKNGRRYNDDMIGVTSNAACSIALRQAIFKVVPFAFVKPVYEAARKVAIGSSETLANRRAKMMAYFAKLGVQQDRVLALIGKPSIEDVGLDDLATLKGVATAIKDGDTSVDDAFATEPKSSAKVAELNAQLKQPAKPAPAKEPVHVAEERAAELHQHSFDPSTASEPAPPDEADARAAAAPAAEAQAPPAEELSDWQNFIDLAGQAAADASVPPSDFEKGINKALVLIAKKGKHQSTTVDWRRKTLAAIRDGQFDFASGTIVK